MEFSGFDARGYRTVDVRTGYAEWVGKYEDTVEDVMDLALLERLVVPEWTSVVRAADLGCGTGRTGQWLRDQGVLAIDGVDVTPEMLARARERGVHARLVEGDVTATGLDAEAYDLVISSLVDEHLADLGPFYREAWRIAAPQATFVLVAFHPHFIMTSGMPTHFTNDAGESVAITTNVHLISDHVAAALAAGWRLAELQEGLIDDAWLAVKPKWARYRDHPISAAYVWRKGA
nr:class I SAM-dependent methyltransferase [Saccharopolyspora hordei]